MWQAGNTAFQQQRHQQAADEYSRAISVKVEDDAFNAVLYCNRAAAYHAVGRYVDAIADCFTAAALDASYVRVPQRRADAYIAIGDHVNAAQVLFASLHIARSLVQSRVDAAAVACADRSQSLCSAYAHKGVRSRLSTGNMTWLLQCSLPACACTHAQVHARSTSCAG